MFSYRKGKHLPTAFQVWGIIAQKLDPAQFSTAKDIWKGVKPVLCKRGRLVFDKVFDKKYVKYRISYLVAVQKKKEAKCYLDNSRKKWLPISPTMVSTSLVLEYPSTVRSALSASNEAAAYHREEHCDEPKTCVCQLLVASIVAMSFTDFCCSWLRGKAYCVL